MKAFAKVLALILCLTMLIPAIASCKKDPEPTPTPTPIEDNEDDNPTPIIDNFTKIASAAQLKSLIDAINASETDITVGKTYKLTKDINMNENWSAEVESHGEVLAAPVTPTFVWTAIKKFSGVLDGNGHTISGIYISKNDTVSDETLGFIGELSGGTIKNLTIANSYIYAKGANGTTLGGLIGTVTGNNAVLENVTVKTNMVSATDGSMNFGGVVGQVAGTGFSMKNVTFAGRVWSVTPDGNIPTTSTTITMSQLIGNGGDKAISLENCQANGRMIPATGTGVDAFCAANAQNLSTVSCTVNDPGEEPYKDIVEIYSAKELLRLTKTTETFAGKTVKLMSNIDLNPSWNAKATISGGVVTLPTAPANVWTGIKEFAGTFEGNGFVISGLYINAPLANDASVGFIQKLTGTVQNLALTDGIVVANAAAATTGVKVAVLAGETATEAAIKTVYTNIDVWTVGEVDGTIAGIVAKNGANEKLTVSDVVYGGTIGTMSATNATPFTTTATLTVGGILGANATADTKATLTNCLFLGATSLDATKVTLEKVAANTISTKTNCFDEKVLTTPGEGWSKSTDYGFLPTVVFAMIVNGSLDYSFYSPYRKVLYIETADQLFALSKLSQDGATFEGQTVVLIADIDLNPGWIAKSTTVYVGEEPTKGVGIYDVTLPTAPKRVWTSIKEFKGTFDGNGHTISGLYQNSIPDSETWKIGGYKGFWGGFINFLNGGTVQNLIVKNSIDIMTNAVDANGSQVSGSADVKHGGLVAVTDGNAVLKDIYLEMDVWNISDKHSTVCGLYGSNKSVTTQVSGIVVKGNIGFANFSMKTGFNPGGNCWMNGVVGRQESNIRETAVSVYDCVFLGELYPIGVQACVRSEICNNGTNGCKSTTIYNSFGSPADAGDPTTDAQTRPLNTVEGLQKYPVINAPSGNTVGTQTYAELGWKFNAELETILPAGVASLLDGTFVKNTERDDSLKIMDTSWYDAGRTNNYIETTEQLISLAQLSQSGVTFEGQTIRLMADFDLNPNWSAASTTVYVGEEPNKGVGIYNVTLPSAPAIQWPGIKEFKGVLDGNGYTISGLYQNSTPQGTKDNVKGFWGGFINQLNGGTVQNLIVKNSIDIMTNAFFDGVEAKGSGDVKHGGLVAVTDGNAVLRNIYLEMDVWNITNKHSSVCGLYGANKSIGTTVSDIVVKGNVGFANFSMQTGFGPGSTCWTNGIIGREESAIRTEASSVSNCVFIGMVFPTGVNPVRYAGVCENGNDGNKAMTLINCVSNPENPNKPVDNETNKALNTVEALQQMPVINAPTGTTVGTQTYAELGWAFIPEIESIVPGSIATLLNGTYTKVTEKDLSKSEYNITYVLGDNATNAATNPATYTSMDNAFTLAAPTRTGYNFIGWTYEGQATPVLNVTIVKGSSGDKTFTANWELEGTIHPDTSWYVGHENDTEYTLTTAAQLLGFAEICGTESNEDAAKKFSGKTVKLGADIDLNPGWDASLIISDMNSDNATVSFPTTPLNVWPHIGIFAGTFDGQGHTIRGIYRSATNSACGMFPCLGNIFNGTDYGGTIKNLVVLNSYVESKPGSDRYSVGGLVGYLQSGSTVENVYIDIDVAVRAAYNGYVGGIVGSTDNEGSTNSISNAVYAGNIVHMDSATSANLSQKDGTKYAEIIARGMTGTTTQINNCLAAGNIIKRSGKSALGASTNDTGGRVDPIVAVRGGTFNSENCAIKSGIITRPDKTSGYDVADETYVVAHTDWTYDAVRGTALPTSVYNMLNPVQ